MRCSSYLAKITHNCCSTSWPVGGDIVSSPGLTVQQTYDIDSKIDDGLPLSGNMWIENDVNPTIFSSNCSIARSPTTCFDNNNARR